MRPLAWLSRAPLAPLAALGLLASLTGCGGDDSVAWLTQPTEGAALLGPPIQLPSGDLVSGGSLARSWDESQAALAKLTADGQVRETRVYNAQWLQIDLAADDQLAFTGQFHEVGNTVARTGLMDSDGTEQWSLPIPGVTRVGSLDRTSLYAIGYDADSAFLDVLDVEGTLRWTYSQDDVTLRPTAAAMASNGDVLLSWTNDEDFGSFDPSTSSVARLDPGGTPLWTRRFDSTLIFDIAVDPTTGSTYFTGASNDRVLIGAIDSSGEDLFFDVIEPIHGNYHYEYYFRSAGGVTIALRTPSDSDGAGSGDAELLVAGFVDGTMDFGLDPLPTDRDGFLLITDTDGDAVWQLASDGPGLDIFSARWAEDGSVLASLYVSASDVTKGGEENTHVAGHDIPIRADEDTALMQIRR